MRRWYISSKIMGYVAISAQLFPKVLCSAVYRLGLLYWTVPEIFLSGHIISSWMSKAHEGSFVFTGLCLAVVSHMFCARYSMFAAKLLTHMMAASLGTQVGDRRPFWFVMRCPCLLFYGPWTECPWVTFLN